MCMRGFLGHMPIIKEFEDEADKREYIKTQIKYICGALIREIEIDDWESNSRLKANTLTVAEDLTAFATLIWGKSCVDDERAKHMRRLKEKYDMPEDIFNAHMYEYDKYIYDCKHFNHELEAIKYPNAIIESPETRGVPLPPFRYLKKPFSEDRLHIDDNGDIRIRLNK